MMLRLDHSRCSESWGTGLGVGLTDLCLRLISPVILVASLFVMVVAQLPLRLSAADQDQDRLAFTEQADRLRIMLTGREITDFVFQDPKIKRPYFSNLRLPDGQQVTRNHPPIQDRDATDHDTMHPGVWLAFGDLNGEDFWRNKATIDHARFLHAPTVAQGQLKFVTESRLKASGGELLGLLTSRVTIVERPDGWRLIWQATFLADQRAIVFGDQEEMGFGARVATGITEKNGGLMISSTGRRTAKETWGQPASWCDYSGRGAQGHGILLMTDPKNFRDSWWHNRDYGLMVANPFGRESLRQGPRSTVTVARGESLTLTFGALIHGTKELDHTVEFAEFAKSANQ